MYNFSVATMTVSEARAALPEVLDRVADGEEVTITRHGRPVAVVVRPDVLWSRRASVALDDAARIHELITEAAAIGLPEGRGLTAERAEELIGEIRAGRDARLWTRSTPTRSSTRRFPGIRWAGGSSPCSVRPGRA
jgi:antitoxin (DNA-binding transcriptional repressor) of toxin-antitoxin stability system